MRLPNGYGSVKKLSGKRRRPWIVEKTICWETNFKTGKIKQKKQIIGYFATKKDALEALAAFNTNPYDLTNDTITLEDCYNKWSDRKYEKIAEKLPEIDKLINETAIGWDTQRMGKVELTIIRLAVYEIRFDETVPIGVAINEAVELAKKFGQEGSSGFVNGILAKFA